MFKDKAKRWTENRAHRGKLLWHFPHAEPDTNYNELRDKSKSLPYFMLLFWSSLSRDHQVKCLEYFRNVRLTSLAF